MVMNEHKSRSPLAFTAEGDAPPADIDPGPLTLLILHEEWLAIGDVQATITAAYNATGNRITDVAGREVALVLTSDADVRALNAQFRGKDKPTNVLSFPSEDASSIQAITGETLPLGDVVIAYETVMREAREEGKPPLHHLSHLTVHGLLHLAGYDHETDEDAERMEALEREILGELAIPDPYLTSRQESGPLAAGACAHE